MFKILIIAFVFFHHTLVARAGNDPNPVEGTADCRAHSSFLRLDWRQQFPPEILGYPSTEGFSDNPPKPSGYSGQAPVIFTGPECKLGIWQNGVNNYPGPFQRVGDYFLPWNKEHDPANTRPHYVCRPFAYVKSGECFTLKDDITNQGSSFTLTGYCECEFFDDNNCEVGLFKAFNRADHSLKTNGPHNDMISSVKCYETKQLERFEMGTLVFYGRNGRAIARDAIDPKMPGWNALGGFSGCRVFAPEVEAAGGPWKVKINGVSCMFFDNYDCQQPAMFWEGSAGLAERDNAPGLDGKIKSYRCFVPWGIGFRKRDDGWGPGPN